MALQIKGEIFLALMSWQSICKQYVNQNVAGWQCKKKTKYDGVKESLEGCLKLGGQGRPSLRRWHLTLSPGRCWVTGVSGPELLSVTWRTGLACLRDSEEGDKGGWDTRRLEETSFQALEVEAKCMDLMLESAWGKKNPPSAGGNVNRRSHHREPCGGSSKN